MLSFWISDPRILAFIARDEELVAAAADHPGLDPATEDPADDGGDGYPGDEAG